MESMGVIGFFTGIIVGFLLGAIAARAWMDWVERQARRSWDARGERGLNDNIVTMEQWRKMQLQQWEGL